MNKWTIIARYVLVFLLGAGAGGLGVMQVARHHGRQAGDIPAMAMPCAHLVANLDRELKLQPEQKARAEAIVANIQREILALRRDSQPGMRAIVRRGMDELRQCLNPDQQKKFDELRQRARGHWRERLDDRRDGQMGFGNNRERPAHFRHDNGAPRD